MSNFLQQGQREWAEDFDLPSGRGFIALLEAFRATGGTAPGEILARLLEEHQVGNAVSLAKRTFTGQAFGFECRGSQWIPMFEFDLDGHCPADRLDADLKAVVQAAQSVASVDEFSARCARRPNEVAAHV